MKFLDSYGDPRTSRALLDKIHRRISRPWTLLDVCGGQAHNLVRFGIDRDLPPCLELIHGPTCPVSAMPGSTIDHAIAIALRPGVIVAAPGDILRNPGERGRDTLLDARSRGADIRVVYSPLDALALARKNPEHDVVVVANGFETTAPAAAAAVIEAERLGLDNLFLLCAFFRLAPAVSTLLTDTGNRAHAVLAAGPVCAVTGLQDYESLAKNHRRPVVITGPGPVDLLDAIDRAVGQLERGISTVENQYDRAVRADGNPQARATIAIAFETVDTRWRGLGTIPASGLKLRQRFRRFDAAVKFVDLFEPFPSTSCCPDAEILHGRLKPLGCPAFGTLCTPERPLSPFIVSAEGVCSAYYRYRREHDITPPAPPELTVMPTSAVPRA